MAPCRVRFFFASQLQITFLSWPSSEVLKVAYIVSPGPHWARLRDSRQSKVASKLYDWMRICNQAFPFLVQQSSHYTTLVLHLYGYYTTNTGSELLSLVKDEAVVPIIPQKCSSTDAMIPSVSSSGLVWCLYSSANLVFKLSFKSTLVQMWPPLWWKVLADVFTYSFFYIISTMPHLCSRQLAGQ